MYLTVDILIELAHEQHVDPPTPVSHCILKRTKNRREVSYNKSVFVNLLSLNHNK